MRQFVANHDTNAAEVHRVVHLLVEKRRLQDTRRKHNFVIRRAVVGVHGGRSHLPFLAVERLADLRNLAPRLKLIRPQEIA